MENQFDVLVLGLLIGAAIGGCVGWKAGLAEGRRKLQLFASAYDRLFESERSYHTRAEATRKRYEPLPPVKPPRIPTAEERALEQATIDAFSDVSDRDDRPSSTRIVLREVA